MGIVVLASYSMNVSTLAEYSSRIVAARKSQAPHLLDHSEGNKFNIQIDNVPSECLLDYNTIADCMKEAGKDIMGMIPLQASLH